MAALEHTPPFRRYMAMLANEPSDGARISAIEEWRKVTITRLRETLAPRGRKGTVKDYAANLEWDDLKSDKPKGK
jgi:hypothetical protein